ncbi:hypothetical protein VUR80DRAFT_3122 [Thermomyces stellatus]
MQKTHRSSKAGQSPLNPLCVRTVAHVSGISGSQSVAAYTPVFDPKGKGDRSEHQSKTRVSAIDAIDFPFPACPCERHTPALQSWGPPVLFGRFNVWRPVAHFAWRGSAARDQAGSTFLAVYSPPCVWHSRASGLPVLATVPRAPSEHLPVVVSGFNILLVL